MSELWGTTNTTSQEPLTVESLEKAMEALRADYPEPPVPVELLSPQEYFRRLGYRNTIPAEHLARLFEEHRT